MSADTKTAADLASLDFAARRLEAVYAQVSQAGRSISAARALLADVDRGVEVLPHNLDLAVSCLRRAVDDYDHAAARAAALNEGNGER